MSRRSSVVGTLLGVGLLSSCASTPNVATYYYLPRAVTQFQVVQTFMCPETTTSQELSVTAAVTAATNYVADFSKDPQVVDYSGYSTPFADTDLAVTRSTDKRLLGINSTSTGEGSTILQDVISLGSAVASAAGVLASGHKSGTHDKLPALPTASTSPCSVVRAHYTGDPKSPPSVSLTYSASIVYGDPANLAAKKSTPTTANAQTTLPIGIDPETTATAGKTNGLGPTVTLTADPATARLRDDLARALPKSPDPFSFQLVSVDAYGLADDVSWPDAPPHASSNEPANAAETDARRARPQ